MSTFVNGKCWPERAPQNEPPIIQHGSLSFSAHVIGWVVSGCFALVAVAVSFWLINRHLTSYTNNLEQRYIVRILFMVPLYAVISFASYIFWNHSNILLLVRDCYESTVLTAFFYLLLAYLSPDPHEQKDIFRKVGLSRENDREARKRGERPGHWMFPLSFVRWKPEDGLYFLQLMKWGVLQYCVIRPTTTLAGIILDSVGLYCADSWSPGWGHIYITVIMSASVTVAMYCLIQLYVPVSGHLAPHKPLLKLVAIKAVVFLTFWQATFIGFFEDFGLIKDTPYMTADNIANGISAICETFEMMVFAFVHIRAFTYKPYASPRRTPRWRSLAHAFNFGETLRELATGTRYMLNRARGRETDVCARREAVLENVFGRSRLDVAGCRVGSAGGGESAAREKLVVGVDKTVHVGAERQWLGTGDDYAYGLEYHMKRQQEKSDGLGEQIEKELTKRGYDRPDLRPANTALYGRVGTDELQNRPSSHTRGQSWWRNIYARLSRTSADQDADVEQEGRIVAAPLRRPRSRSRHRSGGFVPKGGFKSLACSVEEENYDDPPPPSRIQTYRGEQSKKLSRDGAVVPAQSNENELLVSAFRSSSPQEMHLPGPTAGTRAPARSPPPTRRTARPLVAPLPTRQSMHINPALLSPPALSDRSDSFLGRAFTNLPDASSAEDSERSPGPSSVQSHRMQIRLAPEPEIVSRNTNAALMPVVTRPALGLFIPSAGEQDHIANLQGAASMGSRDEFSRLTTKNVPRGVVSRTDPRPTFVNPRHTEQVLATPRPVQDNQPRNPPKLPNRYTPTRDRIVLPTPLAPAVPSVAPSTRDRHSPAAPPPVPNPTYPPPHLPSMRTDRDLPPLPPQSAASIPAPTWERQPNDHPPVQPVGHADPSRSDSAHGKMPNPPALRRSTHNVRRKSVPQLHPTSQDPDPASRNLEAEAEAQRRRRSSRRVTAPAFRVAEPDFSMYDQLPQPILTSESWREQTRARAERQPQRQHRSSRDPEYSRSMTTGRT